MDSFTFGGYDEKEKEINVIDIPFSDSYLGVLRILRTNDCTEKTTVNDLKTLIYLSVLIFHCCSSLVCVRYRYCKNERYIEIVLVNMVSGSCVNIYKLLLQNNDPKYFMKYEFEKFKNFVLVWDEDSFLFYSNESIQRCFINSFPFKISKIIRGSYSQENVVDILQRLPVSAYGRFVISQQFEKSFYFPLFLGKDNGGGIRLINFETGKTLQTLDSHKTQICSISVSKNSQNEEIVICGGTSKIIYFYNMSQNSCLFKKIKAEEKCNTNLVVKKRYLFIGEINGGNLKVFDLFFIKEAKKPLINKKILEDPTSFSMVTPLLDETYYSSSSSSVRLIVSSNKGKRYVKIIRVDGLKFESSFQIKDLMERVEYLRDWFSTDDLEEINALMFMFFISTPNEKIRIFKSFLYL